MDRLFDWLSLALIVAVVFVMVRPGSLGPRLVEVGGGKVVDIVKAVTGGGTWSG